MPGDKSTFLPCFRTSNLVNEKEPPDKPNENHRCLPWSCSKNRFPSIDESVDDRSVWNHAESADEEDCWSVTHPYGTAVGMATSEQRIGTLEIRQLQIHYYIHILFLEIFSMNEEYKWDPLIHPTPLATDEEKIGTLVMIQGNLAKCALPRIRYVRLNSHHISEGCLISVFGPKCLTGENEDRITPEKKHNVLSIEPEKTSRRSLTSYTKGFGGMWTTIPCRKPCNDITVSEEKYKSRSLVSRMNILRSGRDTFSRLRRIPISCLKKTSHVFALPFILTVITAVIMPYRLNWQNIVIACINSEDRLNNKEHCNAREIQKSEVMPKFTKGCHLIVKKKGKKVISKKVQFFRSRIQHQDNLTLTHEEFIIESAEIQLMSPPSVAQNAINLRDEYTRWSTFQRNRGLQPHAAQLSATGFYLTDANVIQCYCCNTQIPIDHFERSNSFEQLRHNPGCGVNQVRQVCSDSPAIVSDDIGDPPGQRSLYIPSGDVRNESYRLSTFERFPATSPVDRRILAKIGFYYTGFFDRVKCFACGRSVERWGLGDDVNNQAWHKRDCPLVGGLPCGNVPINSLFNNLPSNSNTHFNAPPRNEVLEQRDPATGTLVRTVRYPADLPDRIRRSGGIFEIGPNNAIVVQSGVQRRSYSPITVGNESQLQPQRRWRMATVNSSNHRRFLSNLYLNRELDRLTSFARWPVSRPNVSPATLARSGFFYLGDLDRTQCFSCGGVLRNWSLEDEADEEHRTHFGRCALILGTERRNVPIPDHAETEEERIQRYPCLLPSSPHMRNIGNRVETFDSRWPAQRTRATPAEIAEAGFFYLGERDRVKCWYCNGGLQNWEWEDIPWNEHAKWFPNCQFLLRNKGQEFVHRHLALNPHLPRPVIARQEGSTIDPPGCEVQERARSPADVPPAGAQVQQPDLPPTIIDPQQEMRKKTERITKILENSEIVKHVLIMGFAVEVVRQVLEDRIDSNNEANPDDIFEGVGALLDAVMKKEAEQNEMDEEEEEMPWSSMGAASNNYSYLSSVYSARSPVETKSSSFGHSPGSGLVNVSHFGDDPMEDHDIYSSIDMGATGNVAMATNAQTSVQDKIAELEEENACKVCFTKRADMVFIPCSHLCCCMECTKSLRQCPICRAKIEKAIKTYIK